MDLGLWIDAFSVALQPLNLAFLLMGSVYGLIVGALPGLGPLFGVSLMLPLTFHMEPATAIIFLASIQAATTYGDSWASILINTPGGVGSVATAWDGYQLARQGRSGYALGMATMSSLVGGLFGWIALIVISPRLAELSLAMGPAEYTMLGVVALSLLSVAAAGHTIKGLILGGTGLLVSFVGQDQITATSRFTFGSAYLDDGFRIVAIALGLFAFSEALIMAERGGQIAEVRKMTGQIVSGMREVVRRPVTVLRSAIIGILLGTMPALGVSTANIISYLMEKRSSRHPETYGTGNPAGVIAPEVANNACAVAELVPTFTLGIPGSATMAVFLAALLIHGVPLGPALFAKGSIGYVMFAGILLAQIAFFSLGLIGIRWVMKVVTVPFSILVPAIAALTVIGSYADRSRVSDILVMIAFGILGFILKKHHWPPACLVLGLVLGPIIEANFARTMRITDNGYWVFFTRPIPLVLFIIMVFFLLSPYLRPLYRRVTGQPVTPETDNTVNWPTPE